MKKFPIVVCLALAVSMVAVAPTATAAKTTFKNCVTFNKAYPVGVARSETAATAAYARLMERPIVSVKVFTAARKANKKLGTPADGVLCEVKRIIGAPSAPRDVVSTSGATRAVYLQWNNPESDGNAPIIGFIVRGSGTITVVGNKANVSGLLPDTEYTFMVSAVNVAGEGTAASFTTRTNPEAVVVTPVAPSATRYANCTDARAAGVTPIRRGTAMYDANKHLDRDGDGIACE